MARRIAQPPRQQLAEVELRHLERFARSIQHRLRQAARSDGPHRPKVDRAIAAAAKLDPPARVDALLDAAAELRPLLPPAVRRYTLPDPIPLVPRGEGP